MGIVTRRTDMPQGMPSRRFVPGLLCILAGAATVLTAMYMLGGIEALKFVGFVLMVVVGGVVFLAGLEIWREGE